MAGNPECCLSVTEWRARFSGWFDGGNPAALLNASIYFDFRGMYGDLELAGELRRWLCEAARVPVIWATQVLEGLIKRGAPTRAEVTDAAHSVDERADAILLDNMSPAEMARAVKITKGRASLEASGGITLERVRVPAAQRVASPAVAAAAPETPVRDELSLDLGVEPIKVIKAKGAKNIAVGVAHISATFNNTQVTITDMQGKTLITSTLSLQKAQEQTVDIRNLPAGNYLLHISADNHTPLVRKFTKVH